MSLLFPDFHWFPAWGGGAAPIPPPPSNGLQIWLKADAGVTTAGSLVTGWADQSGNGHNASQASTALQPTLLSAGAGINGLPAIRFNNTGADHQACYLTTSFNPSSWAGMTVIYVNRTAASGSIPIYAAVFGWHSTTWWSFNCGSDNTTSQGVGWAGTGGNILLGNTPGLTNGQVVAEAYRYDKANWQMSGAFRHGPVADTSFPGNLGTVWIGTNDYTGTQNTGDIAEILVYDHALSDADLALVNTYLHARYGV